MQRKSGSFETISQMREEAVRQWAVLSASPRAQMALTAVLTALISLILMGAVTTWQSAAHQSDLAEQVGTIKKLQAQVTGLQDNVASLGTENNQQKATIAQQASDIAQMKSQLTPDAANPQSFVEFLKDLCSRAAAIIGNNFIWELLKEIARILGIPIP